MTKKILTQEYLNRRIRYLNGRIYWKERLLSDSASERQMRSWNTRYSGSEIKGYFINSGYLCCTVQGCRFLKHRLIYMIHHGIINSEIDHINRVKTDNRIENLRQATSSDNKRNRPTFGKSEFRGVYFNKKDNCWRSQCSIGGKNKYIGNFKEEKEAAKAYDDFVGLHIESDFAITNEAKL